MYQVYQLSEKPNWITGKLDHIYIGKPLKSLIRAHRKATKLDLEYGATRYGVERVTVN